jgi:hypothetical protein
MVELDELSLAPGVVDLAATVSIAAQVDPALLRLARRRLHPGLTHEAEAAIFHSPLAESRGHHGFVLREEHLPELRLRLVEDGRLDAARGVVGDVHAGLPELVRLEEELTYELLAGRDPAAVERILGMVVAWLRDADDRRPVSRWILRVCRRAPEQLWADPGHATWAFSLVQAASGVLGGVRPGRPATGRGPTLPVLEDRTMPVGVRLNEVGLVLSGSPDGPTRIDVPAAWPVVLSVTAPGGEPATVTLHDTASVVAVPVGLPATVSTVTGRRVELRQAASQMARLDAPVTAVAWSADESAVLVASRQAAVGLYAPTDLEQQRWYPSPLLGDGPVDRLVLAASGARLAASVGEEVRLWHSIQADAVTVYASDGVRAIAIADGVDAVATAAKDGTYVFGPSPVTRVYPATPGPLAVSSRARRLALAAYSARVEVWDLGRANRVRSSSIDLPSLPSALAFSPDERTLGIGTADGRVLLSPATSAALRGGEPAHTTPVDALAFSPDGQLIASGDRAGVIHVWNVADPERPISTWTEHSGVIVGLAWAPDSARVVSAGADATLRIWDVPRAAPAASPAPATTGPAPMHLTVLPAGHGTALVLELGPGPRPFRLVVDGGPRGTYAAGLRAWAAQLPADQRTIDALAVTHSNTSAVGGVVALIEDDTVDVTIADLWYNGWRHAAGSDSL